MLLQLVWFNSSLSKKMKCFFPVLIHHFLFLINNNFTMIEIKNIYFSKIKQETKPSRWVSLDVATICDIFKLDFRWRDRLTCQRFTPLTLLPFTTEKLCEWVNLTSSPSAEGKTTSESSNLKYEIRDLYSHVWHHSASMRGSPLFTVHVCWWRREG